MPKRPETSQTLSRGLDVLQLLAASETALSPAQIATALGLSRTIVYRLVSTLAEYGLVRRDPDGSLTIGLGALRLTRNLHAGLRETAGEHLDRLANAAGATAHLVVADGGEALAVAVVEPRATTFHVAHRVGSRTPLGVGAAGKALVAAAEGRDGLFFSENELAPGAHGVSAPLRRVRGIAAAVGVVTLVGTATPEMRTLVERAAAALDDALDPDDKSGATPAQAPGSLTCGVLPLSGRAPIRATRRRSTEGRPRPAGASAASARPASRARSTSSSKRSLAGSSMASSRDNRVRKTGLATPVSSAASIARPSSRHVSFFSATFTGRSPSCR
ncbi:hypothetical protein BJF79_01755 [Actinomadura sp. CNU-125]|uniref:IclR family transcriptional regulator n=1 Tax=Actinomadura sp. CNU-125 TaxID=1904961 RepID=UPI000960C389|nr:helix-turn-helix domain-containing protein [Actinomadura sp. CNU-125]OLT27344.1 hypothetical protein BJF79_01755 [Actinomadura sp. CNU-125]